MREEASGIEKVAVADERGEEGREDWGFVQEIGGFHGRLQSQGQWCRYEFHHCTVPTPPRVSPYIGMSQTNCGFFDRDSFSLS